MNNNQNIYDVYTEDPDEAVEFTFVSSGVADIIKIVQYTHIGDYKGQDVYNLGFGDYDPGTDEVVDHINTNNGDAYKVFNTVLSTIPQFLDKYDNVIVMVQGSDGRPEFIDNCRLSCTKNCGGEDCRNFKRRINIYRNYVDKHFEDLSIDYQFFGGLPGPHDELVLEEYIPRKNYDAVLASKKIV